MKNDTLALIPARGGSKGVPGKNIKLLGGYPLIAYSICVAKMTKSIKRVIVSTDSEEIADISKKYGAEAPFLRPADISRDNSTDLELFRHVIGWLEKDRSVPRMIVHLRPTTPFREAREIDRAIESMQASPDATSLRSVHEHSEPPYKMFQLDTGGYLRGFFPDDPRPEYYNLPRQTFPKAYHPNGYVDIVKTDFIRQSGKLHGPNMLAFITPMVTEVDKPEDFEYLEYQLNSIKNSVYDYLSRNFSRED